MLKPPCVRALELHCYNLLTKMFLRPFLGQIAPAFCFEGWAPHPKKMGTQLCTPRAFSSICCPAGKAALSQVLRLPRTTNSARGLGGESPCLPGRLVNPVIVERCFKSQSVVSYVGLVRSRYFQIKSWRVFEHIRNQ